MMPSTLVYFEALPDWIALIAASLTLSGVSKSGSPAPSPITSRPASLSARALSVTAMVADGLMRLSESARKAMADLSGPRFIPLRMSLIGEPVATSPGHAPGLLLQRDVLMRAAE